MRIWKQEELDYLSSVAGEVHRKDIAKNIDRTPNAIQIKAGELGISLRSCPINKRFKYSEETFNKVRSLAIEGELSGAEIARRCGVSPTYVSDVKNGKFTRSEGVVVKVKTPRAKAEMLWDVAKGVVV